MDYKLNKTELECTGESDHDPEHCPKCERINARIAALVKQAVAEEREACARVADFAIRLVRLSQPLDDGGICIYCENRIAEIGKQDYQPHDPHCLWKLLQIEVEEYNGISEFNE